MGVGVPGLRVHAQGHDNVHVAVAVHVHRLSVGRVGRRGVHGMTLPRHLPAVPASPVLVPGHQVRLMNRGQQVLVPVSVEVGRPDGQGLGGSVVPCAKVVLDGMPRPASGSGPSPVLEPEEMAPLPGRCGGIQVSVPVQIGQRHVVGVGHGAGEDQTLPQPAVPRVSPIAKPEQIAMEVLDRHHVQVAVAVHVADGVALQAFGVVSGDEMAPEVSGTVVLQPIEGIVSEGVRTGQVHVAVAVQVRRRDAEGIGVAVEDQVLGESGGVSRQGRAGNQGGQDEENRKSGGTGRKNQSHREALAGERPGGPWFRHQRSSWVPFSAHAAISRRPLPSRSAIRI